MIVLVAWGMSCHACLRTYGHAGIPGEPVLVESEEDVFTIIDYPYKKPNERNL